MGGSAIVAINNMQRADFDPVLFLLALGGSCLVITLIILLYWWHRRRHE